MTDAAQTNRESRRTVPSWLLWCITWAIAASAVGVGLRLALAGKPAVPPPERRLANVAVQEVRTRPYAESLILPARLEADRMAPVNCELTGRLERWLVEESSNVSAGQALAELNDDDLRAKLAELHAQAGSAMEQVKVAGQDLAVARATLEQTRQDAAALQLTLDSSQANLDFAQKDAARITGLADAAITTQAELENARNRLVQAELDVAKAKDAIGRAASAIRTSEARVEQSLALLELSRSRVREVERAVASLQVTLDKAMIRAPFAGRFDERLAEVGEVVSPGQLLGRVYDVEHLRVAVDVPDRYAPFLRDGSPLFEQYLSQAMPGARQKLKAVVQIPGLPRLTGGTHAGVELPAEIARVAEAANSVSHTFRVELRFPNPGLALREGMIVRAQIDLLAYAEAIVVPLSAVQVADVGTRALVVVADAQGRSIAQVRDIEPLSIRNDQVLVRDGLKSGDRLVVAGGRGVLDGEEVLVVMADGVVVDRTEEGKEPFLRVAPKEAAEAAEEDGTEEPAGGEDGR